MRPDFYWQISTCLFISRPRNVLDSPERITTMSQNKCLYIYLLLFSDSKLNSQCFLWVSQPRMTSSPKPEAVAYFIQLCMWNIPWLFHTQPWPVRVQLFETIYGTEWAVSCSNNPSLAIFIITSYKAAHVYLADAKYRHSLPHTPTGTKLGPDKWCM